MTLCNNNARIPYSQTDNVQIWRAPRQVFCFIVAYPCKIAACRFSGQDQQRQGSLRIYEELSVGPFGSQTYH